MGIIYPYASIYKDTHTLSRKYCIILRHTVTMPICVYNSPYSQIPRHTQLYYASYRPSSPISILGHTLVSLFECRLFNYQRAVSYQNALTLQNFFKHNSIDIKQGLFQVKKNTISNMHFFKELVKDCLSVCPLLWL